MQEDEKSYKIQFQIKMTNRFQALHYATETDDDIIEWNNQINKAIQETSISTAGISRKKREPKGSDEIQRLLKKRRDMKRNSTVSRIEYAELCKNVRKKNREHTRERHMQQINKTISENQSLKNTARQAIIGKQDIISLNEIINQEKS